MTDQTATLPNMTLQNLFETVVPWAEAFHERSASKGWWEGGYERNLGEMMLLIKSEIVEAFEEYRNPDSNMAKTYFVGESKKPEGVPIELADAVIRLGDLMASSARRHQKKLEYSQAWETIGTPMKNDPVVGEVFDDVTIQLGKIREFVETRMLIGNDHVLGKPEFDNYMRGLVKATHAIFTIAEAYKIDLGTAVRLKHEYNGTRPHRHGGKKA